MNKLCSECRWSNKATESYSICQCPKIYKVRTSLVTGEESTDNTSFCTFQRSFGAPLDIVLGVCGKRGRFWTSS